MIYQSRILIQLQLLNQVLQTQQVKTQVISHQRLLTQSRPNPKQILILMKNKK